MTRRRMFSLARAGQARRGFGEIGRRGTPGAALLLSSSGIALATLWNILFPDTSFTLMMAISMFGAMFTWLMIFVTHLFFRSRHAHKQLAFRMWGYPYSSAAGPLLMAALLPTTFFSPEFRMTLGSGIPPLLPFSFCYWNFASDPITYKL